MTTQEGMEQRLYWNNKLDLDTGRHTGNYCNTVEWNPRREWTYTNKYVNIEDLNIGDFIHTPISNKQQKIKRIIRNTHNR